MTTDTARPIPLPTVPERDAEAGDLDALARRVLRAVEYRGWADIRHPLAEAEFEAIARRLGVIELRSDVVVSPESERRQAGIRISPDLRPSIYQDAELEFHTDRPTADWLAWYCVRQDEDDGATLLLDARDLLGRFSAEELDRLARIEVRYSRRDPGTDREESLLHPLVERDGGALRLYYVPWLVDPSERDERALLDEFARSVKEERERSTLGIRLEESQSLFIDNRRLLHGRGPLRPDSLRHLIRLYIQRRPQEGRHHQTPV